MLKPCALFALTLLLAACIGAAPDYVIRSGKMEDILHDYLLAQAMAEQGGGDIDARQYEYVQAVFAKYDVTEAQFDSSMAWYARDAEQLYVMYGRITKRLEREGGITQGQGAPSLYSQLGAEGDTANVWSYGSFLALVATETDNIQKFTVKADTSYLPGDYYKLVFDPYIMQSFGSQEAYVLTQVTYTNDSTYATAQRISSGYPNEVNVPQAEERAEWTTRQLKFTFYMPAAEGDGLSLCCLSNIALVRFHKPKPVAEAVAPADSDSVAVDTITLQ